MISSYFYYILIGFSLLTVSFFVAHGIYPFILRMSRIWKFYDHPNARKLQQTPIPVLGGMVVFLAICITCLVLYSFVPFNKLLYMLLAMGLLFITGLIDDRYSLRVKTRFIIEILVISLIIILNGRYINTLGGLWGIEHLCTEVALPLSIITGLGIINALNLIDGIDGYSSAYVIMVCLGFATIFYISQIPVMAIMCLICAGALIPFLMHNVFGNETKMFIGDSGTLMLGMMLTIFSFSVLREGSLCYKSLQMEHNVGLIALTLAILSLCIFDTLRVMICRILQGKSPFHADKTHLHHLFINAGFSHIGATLSLLALNTLIILGWFGTWILGCEIEFQFYIVVSLGIITTAGLYGIMSHGKKINNKTYRYFCHIGKKTHWENTKKWKWIERWVDDELSQSPKNA